RSQMGTVQYIVSVLAPTSDAANSEVAQQQLDAINKKLADQANAVKDALAAWQRYDQELGVVGANMVTTLKQQQDSAAATSRLWATYTGFLGDAATFSEKANAQIAAAYSTLKDNKTGLADAGAAADAYGRKIDAINLDKQIAQQGALNTILGIAATVQD